MSGPDRVDTVVIGAGVIGLAVARRLALAGREVLILERAEAIGTETSARNSEVIHAGIYYPQGSLKARLCVEGKERLYAYCEERGIPFRRCGKLIVATEEAEPDRLAALQASGQRNGVADLRLLDRREARALEPALECKAALLSPSTGIIDSHALMLAYQGEAEAHGAVTVLHTAVTGGAISEDGIELVVGDDPPLRLLCRLVINGAGLHAVDLASRLRGFPRDRLPPFFLAKGNYYRPGIRPPFSRLIYPVPEPGGLGVHITLDLGGQARFGPDVEWIDRIDYDVDPSRAERFSAAVRRYWPGLPAGTPSPDYAGIRPKLAGPGEPAADFLIQGPDRHGVPGLVNLFGIESPGLTASLAIADHVAGLAAP